MLEWLTELRNTIKDVTRIPSNGRDAQGKGWGTRGRSHASKPSQGAPLPHLDMFTNLTESHYSRDFIELHLCPPHFLQEVAGWDCKFKSSHLLLFQMTSPIWRLTWDPALTHFISINSGDQKELCE